MYEKKGHFYKITETYYVPQFGLDGPLQRDSVSNVVNHYPDKGQCQSSKRTQVVEPELSLCPLFPLLAGLPSKEYTNQAGLGFPLGEGKKLHAQEW